MAENWRERIENIGQALLSLEVDTAIKNGMVAQKMPEVPVALHVIVEAYADHVQEQQHPVTDYLLRAAASRICDLEGQSERFRVLLENWPFKQQKAPWDPPGWPADWPVRELPIGELGNGAEVFEALQWAAFGAAQSTQDPRERAVLARIRSNSRQLKEVAAVLERQFSAGAHPDLQTSTQTLNERLCSIATGADRAAELRESRLFGATLEQTAAALFKHPRPSLSIDPDLIVLIRKAWDLGLEEVLFQTVIQLDGDVIVRVAELSDDAQRIFLGELHRRAADAGTGQWRLLFQIAGDLMGRIGELIFGPKLSR